MTSQLETPTPAPDRRRRRLVIAAIVTVLVVGFVAAPTVVRLLGNPAGGDPAVGVDVVSVHGDAFDPPVIQIEAGTTVSWTFEDGGRAHNVVGGGWSSDVLTSGRYQRTFTEPGSHPYSCTLHWGMDGQVDVVPTP